MNLEVLERMALHSKVPANTADVGTAVEMAAVTIEDAGNAVLEIEVLTADGNVVVIADAHANAMGRSQPMAPLPLRSSAAKRLGSLLDLAGCLVQPSPLTVTFQKKTLRSFSHSQGKEKGANPRISKQACWLALPAVQAFYSLGSKAKSEENPKCQLKDLCFLRC